MHAKQLRTVWLRNLTPKRLFQKLGCFLVFCTCGDVLVLAELKSLSLSASWMMLVSPSRFIFSLEFSFSHFFPHYFTCQSYWNSVTLWKLHLPNNGGRYATASRKGRVSTCRSAGSCLNWCSIRRAISKVRAHSYLWNNTVCRASTPNLLWHQEKVCVRLTPPPNTHAPIHACGQSKHTYTGFSTNLWDLKQLWSYCASLFSYIEFIWGRFCGHLYLYVSVKLPICLIHTAIPGFGFCEISTYRSLVILLFPHVDDVNAIEVWSLGWAILNNVL